MFLQPAAVGLHVKPRSTTTKLDTFREQGLYDIQQRSLEQFLIYKNVNIRMSQYH